MSSQSQLPHHVSNVFEQNGKLYLKTFLIDDSVNHAKWGIRSDYIAKHIDRFVGRPFILTAHRNHPLEFYGAIREDYNDVPGTIQRYLHAQERYRIGTIKKVEPYPSRIETAGVSGTSAPAPSSKSSSSPSSSSNHDQKQEEQPQKAWFAYIEITDPVAISAFKAGNIPKYVSPTVFRLNHFDSPSETTDYEPLHLAAVDLPAYGFDKAGIRGSCEGDLVSCSKQLQNASAVPVEDCGFCVKGTLEGFTNHFSPDVNSSFVKSGLNHGSDLTENKQDSVPAQSTATVAQNPAPTDTQRQEQQAQPQQQQAPIEPNKTGAGQPFTKVEPAAEKQLAAPAAKEEQKKETGAESKEKDSHTKQSNTSQQSPDEVAELNKRVQALLEKVNGLESYKENQEKTVRDQKDATRRSKIEAAIPENYANSPDERKKAIDTLMRYDNDEQLDYVLNSFVAPTINAQNKPRVVQQRSNKLTDYGTAKANTNTNVQQGSAPTIDIEKMRRVCAMSDIVGNAVFGGGF